MISQLSNIQRWAFIVMLIGWLGFARSKWVPWICSPPANGREFAALVCLIIDCLKLQVPTAQYISGLCSYCTFWHSFGLSKSHCSTLVGDEYTGALLKITRLQAKFVGTGMGKRQRKGMWWADIPSQLMVNGPCVALQIPLSVGTLEPVLSSYPFW